MLTQLSSVVYQLSLFLLYGEILWTLFISLHFNIIMKYNILHNIILLFSGVFHIKKVFNNIIYMK